MKPGPTAQITLRLLPRILGLALLACVIFLPSHCLAQVTALPGTTSGGSQPVRFVLIILLFLVVAALIATRKLPAMLALPLMALGIGLIAGIPFQGENGILLAIMEGKTTGASPTGSFQLYKAIIWVLFGGIFARFIADTRIAEKIVKYAAEFSGENPFNVSLIMSAITIIIFTAAGGLPMIIMLGTVMFPILLSLGVPAVVCGCILALSFPIGVSLNPGEWARISEVFGVPLPRVKLFFLVWAAIQVAVFLTFLSIEFLRMKRIQIAASSIALSIVKFVGAGLLICVLIFLENILPYAPESFHPTLNTAIAAKTAGAHIAKYLIWVLLAYAVFATQYNYHIRKRTGSSNWNLITPILPLVFLLVLGFDTAFIPAFLASLAYGVFTTPQPQALQRLGKSMINGISDVAAPMILMVGIGMLIAAATHPTVEGILTPVLAQVIPTTAFGYVLFFLLAAPLSLYRGPLNPFGLGIGIARLLQNFIPAGATMGALQSVSMLQDPTTTQNVWICGFLKLDINALLFKLFLYSIVLVISGLLLSAFLFFPGR